MAKRKTKEAFGKKKRSSKQRGLSGGRRKKCLEEGKSVANSEQSNISDDSFNEQSSISDVFNIKDLDIQSAAIKKQAYFSQPTFDFSSSNESSEGYRIVSMESLHNLVEALACPKCGQKNLKLSEKKTGMMTVFITFCKTCEEDISEINSSKYNAKYKAYESNLLAVSSAKNNGIGYTKLVNFFSCMKVAKPFHLRSYQLLCAKVAAASKKALEEHFLEVAAIIKNEYKSMEDTTTDDITNIAVSYDGTWQKRGFSSMFGIGAIIDLLTGLVIDVAVISKYCHGCALSKKNPLKYKKHECQINFEGSSAAMEVEAALILFGRSVEKYGIRYLTVLSDGDSKSYQKLTESNVYGDKYKIQKEECINHVSKRMGSALRKLKETRKSTGSSLGGRGKLTNETIEKMQNYYGRALKDNAPDIVKMKNSVFASLFHMVSTDAEPHHKFCPTGPQSWCHFNRALENPVEKRPHKPTIPKFVGEAVLHIYQRLTNTELLERCTRNKTQNNNESLHSIIWQKCPKTSFASLRSVSNAASLAVLQFNKGPQGFLDVIKILNIPIDKIQLNRTAEILKRKISDSVKASSSEAKIARKTKKKITAKKTDEYEQKEGIMYDAGAF